MYHRILFPTSGLCQSLPLLALYCTGWNPQQLFPVWKKEKCEDTSSIWNFFYGITVTTLLCSYFHEGVWDEGIKTREHSKVGPVLVPAFHNVRRWHEAKCFGARGTFSFTVCCDTTSHCGWKFQDFAESQIYNIQNKQIILELIFFKKILQLFFPTELSLITFCFSDYMLAFNMQTIL